MKMKMNSETENKREKHYWNYAKFVIRVADVKMREIWAE